MVYNAGTTIMLQLTFTDWHDELKDPDTLTIKVFTDGKRFIKTISISLDESYRISLGVYEVPFIIPADTEDSLLLKIIASLAGYPVVEEQTIEIAG